MHAKEPGFRDSVDLMFNRAVALMDLPPGLEEKIRVCNATYTVRFGVRLRGAIKTFTGYRSADGTNWTLQSSARVSMAKDIFVGLVVSAHNNQALNTSTFDNLKISKVEPLPGVSGSTGVTGSSHPVTDQ